MSGKKSAVNSMSSSMLAVCQLRKQKNRGQMFAPRGGFFSGSPVGRASIREKVPQGRCAGDNQLPLGTQKTQLASLIAHRAEPFHQWGAVHHIILPQGLAQIHYFEGRTETRPCLGKSSEFKNYISNTIVLPILLVTTGTGICYHEDKK